MASQEPINPAQREQIETLFDAALELSAPRREAWLESRLADQPAVRDEVKRLLRAEAASHRLFADLEGQRFAILGEVLPDGEAGLGDPRINARYGPWRIEQHIGTGGVGEVYQVCRDDGRYDQRAALKILRPGILGEHARSLFLRERRLLANLDVSGVVRIIDGGETRTGAPWLVMELAEGTPIDQHCAGHHLPLPQRLALLAETADVLNAAHARLVIHGDIKPEHVLIDARDKPRLLDFGIAQALDEQGLGRSAEGFSPRLASPEQTRGESLTTASDIYQMGRLIDLVVAGQPQDTALRALIAKATAPAPTDRYASMAGLAADLRALIADRPLAAMPDRPLQALQRLVRHNRLAAGLAAVVLLGSAGWGVTATLASARIEKERTLALAAADRERRGKDMLLQLFRRADILEADSLGMEPVAAAAMLDEVLDGARKSLADDPALLADLVNWAARAHLRANNPERVLALAEEELTLVGRAGLRGTLREGAAKAFHAHILARLGQREQAEQQSSAALALLDKADSADPRALDLLISLAWAAEGDWVRQKSLFQRAAQAAGPGAGPSIRIELHSGLGRALTGLGELAEGRKQIDQAVKVASAAFGERHPRVALPLSDLGRLEERAGNYQAAIGLHRRALDISVGAFGATHPSSLAHRNNLALAMLSAGQADAAIAELETLLTLRPDSLERGETAQNLAAALVQRGRFARADQVLAIAEASFAAHLAPGHPRRAFPALTRAEMRLAQRRFKDAEQAARSAFDHLSKALPPGHFAAETARCRIGQALIGQGRKAAARPFVETALASLAKPGSGAPARLVEPCRSAARLL